MRTFVFLVLALSSLSAAAEWRVTSKDDPMSDQVQAWASTGWTDPMSSISGIYADLQARLVYQCEGKDELIFLRFSEIMNPSPSSVNYNKGYQRISVRIRWDDQEARQFYTRTLSSGKAMNLNRYWRDELMQHHEVMVETSWYSAGRVIFKFSLAGSSDAIREARGKCRG